MEHLEFDNARFERNTRISSGKDELMTNLDTNLVSLAAKTYENETVSSA
jgi:hypothetical protein